MLDASAVALPLDGVRILSLEQFGAGPFGTLFLASLGAEVIKIEEPVAGDVSRQVGAYAVEGSDQTDANLYFQALNLGKKSITLDLKHPDSRAVFLDLVRTADAVASNLRGDVVGKLGLTYDDLKATNPAIVCAHLTAYGRDNERASWPGYDYIMQAEAGYCALTGEPGSPPTRFGLSIVDWMAGLSTAIGLLSGVIRARASGAGGDVDVSLFDVALYNLNYVALWTMNAGYHPEKVPRGGHPAQAPSQMFRTSDGWIYLMCGAKEKFWRDLCRIVDREHWLRDPRFADPASRAAHRDQLTVLLDDVLGAKTTAEWLALMGGRLPVGPVLGVEEALSQSYLKTTGRIVEVPYGEGATIRTLRNPVRWRQASPVPSAAPSLGRDTVEVLRGVGMQAEPIERLARAGVI